MKWRHRTAKFLSGIGGGALPPLLPLLCDETVYDLATGGPQVYPLAIDRKPGRTVTFKATSSGGTYTAGWDVNQLGGLDSDAFSVAGTTASVLGGPEIGEVPTGSEQTLVVTLRASGSFFLVGDALFYKSDDDSSTPLYAGWVSPSATGSMSQTCVPNFLWTPTPICADTGTSADVAGTYYTDGGTLTGVEAGGDGVAWNGDTWSNGVDGAKNAPALGAELLTNIDFSAWTGDNPDDWIVSSENENNYVTEDANGARIASNGGLIIYIQQHDISTVGKWYRYVVEAHSVSGSGVTLRLRNALTLGYITAPGTSIFTYRTRNTTNNRFEIWAQSTTDTVIASCSAKEIPTADLFRSITTGTTPFIYTEADGTLGDGAQAGSVLMLDDEADPQNFVIVYHDGTSVIADKCLAGVYTNLFTQADAEVPGILPTATTRDNGDGTAQLWVWYDGAYIADMEVADAGIIGNTLYGEFSTSDTNRITHFLAYGTGGHTPPGA